MQLSFISCLSPSQRTKNRTFQSFTLIELLVVIAILAILAVAVVLVLNPVELIKESRDTTRIEDLTIINKALSLIQVDQPNASFGSSTTVYVSIPWTTTSTNCSNLGLPTLPSGYAYGCAPTSTYQRADGTGWIPVDFTSFSAGAPFSKLPADPVNATSSGLYYTYIPGGSWKLTALFESADQAPKAKSDGGVDPAVYEQGSSLSLAPFVRGLAGYWDFEEGSGSTAADSSGNGNTGTLYGTSSLPVWTSGKVGSALDFDGSEDYVNASTFGFPTSSSSRTLAMWIYPRSFSPDSFIVGWGGITYPYAKMYGLALVSGNFYRISYGEQGWAAGIPATLNQWQHVVLTYGDGTDKLYVNGEYKATAERVLNTTSDDFRIGLRLDGAGPYNGSIDDVRIYNRVLSIAEVQAIYNATR